VRVKVVKNKVAPPFKQAEFDIIYGEGISWEGSVLDVGLERKIVQKSGSYFSYEDERLGQGRQNATAFLREHPDVTEGVIRAVQAQIGPEAAVSSRLLPEAGDEVATNGKAAAGSDPESDADAEAEANAKPAKTTA
jgi:recombination protein RecA